MFSAQVRWMKFRALTSLPHLCAMVRTQRPSLASPSQNSTSMTWQVQVQIRIGFCVPRNGWLPCISFYTNQKNGKPKKTRAGCFRVPGVFSRGGVGSFLGSAAGPGAPPGGFRLRPGNPVAVASRMDLTRSA